MTRLILTADRMRDQGAQTIQDALRYTAGVRGETYGLDRRGDWSTVRGTDPVEVGRSSRGGWLTFT